MQKGAFEKDARWVGGTIADIVPSTSGGADQVVGMFEVGIKVAEGHGKSRAELLQLLRVHIASLAIFGESPVISRTSIQGRAPEYAKPAEIGMVAMNYRLATENDVPVWPGIIKSSAIYSREEGEESYGNV